MKRNYGGQEIIEKSSCLSVIARVCYKKKQRRTRDREPFRIPVRRVLKVLTRKLVSQRQTLLSQQKSYIAVSTKVVPPKREGVRDNADWFYG